MEQWRWSLSTACGNLGSLVKHLRAGKRREDSCIGMEGYEPSPNWKSSTKMEYWAGQGKEKDGAQKTPYTHPPFPEQSH